MAIRPWGIAPLDDEERWANDAGTGSWLAVSGHLFHELGGATSRTGGIATRLLRSLSARGEAAMADFDGNFAIAWFDGQSRRLRLFRDRFGLEGLYYAEVGPNLVFGSRVRDILATGLLPGGLCPQGLAEYLTFCYIPSDATLDRGVRQVEASGLVTVGPDGRAVRSRWYRLSFAGATLTDEQDIGDEFRTRLEAAVVRRATAPRPGAFLSGGMDSPAGWTRARWSRFSASTIAAKSEPTRTAAAAARSTNRNMRAPSPPRWGPSTPRCVSGQGCARDRRRRGADGCPLLGYRTRDRRLAPRPLCGTAGRLHPHR